MPVLGQIWPFLGQKSIFLGGGCKPYGTLISGNQWDTSFVLKILTGVFLAKNPFFSPKKTKIAKILIFFWGELNFWPQISRFSGQNCTFLFLMVNWSRTGQWFQHERGVSLVPWYEDTKSFTPSPPKWILAQKWPNLAQNWHFWPNIGIFGPFDLMPDQKTSGQVV